MNLDALKKLSPEEKKNLITTFKQEVALANLEALVTGLVDKCTTKCITNPGTSLTNGEKQCLQRCMGRFLESWNVVSTTLQKRLAEESMNLNKLSASHSTPAPLFGNNESTFS